MLTPNLFIRYGLLVQHSCAVHCTTCDSQIQRRLRATKFKVFGKDSIGHINHLVPCISHIDSTFTWFWQIWSKYGCSKVCMHYEYAKYLALTYNYGLDYFEIHYYHFFIIFSCLPSWSKDDPLSMAYIWYICVAGAFIPSAIMIASNIIVLCILKKVIRYKI